jgi:hypothetical protein
MPSTSVLKSVAHNQAHSFISSMNYWHDGFVPCHLVRASKEKGPTELFVDLISREAGPGELLVPKVAGSVDGYCENFRRLVTSGGSAMELIASARMTVRIDHGLRMGAAVGVGLHARLTSRVVIVDTRGREHVGEHLEPWECGLDPSGD